MLTTKLKETILSKREELGAASPWFMVYLRRNIRRLETAKNQYHRLLCAMEYGMVRETEDYKITYSLYIQTDQEIELYKMFLKGSV